MVANMDPIQDLQQQNLSSNVNWAPFNNHLDLYQQEATAFLQSSTLGNTEAQAPLLQHGNFFFDNISGILPDWLAPDTSWLNGINTNPPLDFLIDPFIPPQAVPSMPSLSNEEDHEVEVDVNGLINAPHLLAPSTMPSPKLSPTEQSVDDGRIKSSYAISSAEHAVIIDRIRKAYDVTQTFTFPTQFGMGRYLKGFMNGFQRHFPFLHRPSFHLCDVHPFLVLNILCLGAQYVFEQSVALKIFALSARIARTVKETHGTGSISYTTELEQLEHLQATLLHIVFGTWCMKEGLHQEALASQSLLAGVSVWR